MIRQFGNVVVRAAVVHQAAAAPLSTVAQPNIDQLDIGGGSPDSKSAYRQMLNIGSVRDITSATQSLRRSEPNVFRAALREHVQDKLGALQPLERHIKFFDKDNDGTVHFGETYNSARCLNFGVGGAVAIALFSHTASLFKTWSWNVQTQRIFEIQHPAVHSGAFDRVSAQADESKIIADKVAGLMAFDFGNKGYLTKEDFGRYVDAKSAANTTDWFWTRWPTAAANKGEFGGLVTACNGQVTEQDLLDFYTGSLPYALAPSEEMAERIVNLRS